MTLRKLRYRTKRFLVEISQDQAASHYMALSFAIAVFISILPTPLYGVAIGLGLTLVFKKLNRPTLLFGFFVSNPIFFSPLIFLAYQIGAFTFKAQKPGKDAEVWEKMIFYFKNFLFGNIILATTFAVLGYFLIYQVSESYKRRSLKKRAERNHKRAQAMKGTGNNLKQQEQRVSKGSVA